MTFIEECKEDGVKDHKFGFIMILISAFGLGITIGLCIFKSLGYF